MPTRNLGEIQSVLNALTGVESNINELKYYKSCLESPNHSYSECSSVCSTINTLSSQVLAVAKNLLYYGHEYQVLDEELAASNDPNYTPLGVCYDFTYTRGDEHKKGFWEKTFNQIILGDFSEDSSWLGTTGSIILSFTGADAPMDVRDFVANAKEGKWGWAALNAISLLPIVGGIGKTGSTIVKHGDDIIEGGSQIAKHGDDFYDAGRKVLRHGDDIIEGGSTIIKHGDDIIEGTSKIAKSTNIIDSLGDTSSSTKKVLWETAAKKQYIIADGTFSVIDNTGTTLKQVDKVGVISDFSYIKKAPDELEAARKAFNSEYKPAFLKKLAEENIDDLHRIGLSDDEIDAMRKGIQPEGFEVHHKLSLDDGGENTFDNFILIDDESHDIFTGYQNTFTKTNSFKESGSAVIDWVYPTGSVYIP